MTPQQQRLFDYLREYIGDCGAPPTCGDIPVSLGIAVTDGLRRLLTRLDNYCLLHDGKCPPDDLLEAMTGQLLRDSETGRAS